MTDPFTLLGVPDDADDEAVRKAYLEAVRRHPPEREPIRFQAVRAAYDAIASRRGRVKYRLFGTPAPELAPLQEALLAPGGETRPPTASELLALLGESLRHYRPLAGGEGGHGR